MKLKFKPFVTGLISIIVLLPSLTNYFSGDDWYHLRLTQISTLSQFFNFFSFSNTPQSTPFFRPISTQLPFYLLQKVFGLNPFFYHLVYLSVFALSLWLIYQIVLKLTKSTSVAHLALFIYGFSHTNFTRLYYLSAGTQELLLLLFTLLTINLYLNKSATSQILSYLCLALALLSKETAIFIPVYLLLADLILRKKSSLARLLPYVFLVGVYLVVIRSRLHGVIGDSTYTFNFSPKTVLNTSMWYFLWALGAPELLVDYIGSGFRPVPRLFTDLPLWSWLILAQLLAILTLTISLVYKNYRHLFNKQLLFAVSLFVLGLGPLILLPQHKFTLEMGLALLGFSLGVALLLVRSSQLRPLFLALYLVFNLSTSYLAIPRHYTTTRAVVSSKIVTYLNQYYPKYPKDSFFYFANDTTNFGADWGSSKQIAHATNVSELFRVYYHDPSITVYYQDLDPQPASSSSIITLSTRQFLP